MRCCSEKMMLAEEFCMVKSRKLNLNLKKSFEEVYISESLIAQFQETFIMLMKLKSIINKNSWNIPIQF